MKKLYKRKAYLLDDGVWIAGLSDKYGFHPNDISCGFTTQKFRSSEKVKLSSVKNVPDFITGMDEKPILIIPTKEKFHCERST